MEEFVKDQNGNHVIQVAESLMKKASKHENVFMMRQFI